MFNNAGSESVIKLNNAKKQCLTPHTKHHWKYKTTNCLFYLRWYFSCTFNPQHIKLKNYTIVYRKSMHYKANCLDRKTMYNQ